MVPYPGRSSCSIDNVVKFSQNSLFSRKIFFFFQHFFFTSLAQFSANFRFSFSTKKTMEKFSNEKENFYQFSSPTFGLFPWKTTRKIQKKTKTKNARRAGPFVLKFVIKRFYKIQKIFLWKATFHRAHILAKLCTRMKQEVNGDFRDCADRPKDKWFHSWGAVPLLSPRNAVEADQRIRVVFLAFFPKTKSLSLQISCLVFKNFTCFLRDNNLSSFTSSPNLRLFFRFNCTFHLFLLSNQAVSFVQRQFFTWKQFILRKIQVLSRL